MRCLIGSLFAGTIFASAQTNETASVGQWLSSKVDPDTTVYALSIVFVLTFLLTFYVGVLYFRERRRIKQAVTRAARHSMLPVPAPSREVLSMQDWQQRALTAEARAGNQAQLLREKLMPELAEFVKQSLVQGLRAQRDSLAATQEQAHQALLEMESRLAALRTPLQERIRVYENRITELEKELSVQGAEMRELTRTFLQLMRKKLEAEQEKAPVVESFN